MWPLRLKIYLYLIVVSSITAKKHNGDKGHYQNRDGNDNVNPIIETANGRVQGQQFQTVGLNKTIYSFRGIPYAQPPLGNLRFKAPLPANKWNNIFNATVDGHICIQTDNIPYTSNVIGSEDCLFINVYTPTLNKSALLPVMVWIYGGTFLNGDSTYKKYGPDYLLDNDGIIFVSFNYRLGIFGFLSTGDAISSGNYGLKDQILALKWVQNNIENFGGDPKRVTIFGESAGSVSVSYLLEIKKAQGLFHGAILQSGSALCLWALSRIGRRIAFFTGKELGITTNNSQILVDGLRKIDAVQLQKISINNMVLDTILNNPRNGFGFSPVQEPDVPEAVFTQKSHELLRRGDFNRVPTIIGHNSLELMFPFILPARVFVTGYDLMPGGLVPIDMNADKDVLDRVGRIIKSWYFGNFIPIALQEDKAIIDFVSDDMFNRPVTETVSLISKYAPVYFYVFSYTGNLSDVVVNRPYQGVAHSEDLSYIFRTYRNASSGDALARSRITKLWTNFAKHLNPTPNLDPLLQNVTWPRTNALENGLIYLDIGDDLGLEMNPNQKNLLFWKHLYTEFGHPEYDTY